MSPHEIERAIAFQDRRTPFVASDVEIKPNVRILIGLLIGRNDVTETDLRAFADQALAEYKSPNACKRLAEVPPIPTGNASAAPCPTCSRTRP